MTFMSYFEYIYEYQNKYLIEHKKDLLKKSIL